MLFIAFLILSVLSISIEANEKMSSLKASQNIAIPSQNLTVLERWQHFEIKIKDSANTIVRVVLPTIMESFESMNLSSQCMREGLQLIAGIRNIKTWAIRFIDSSAKIMDGILTGSMSSFGSYDECLDTEVKSTKFRDRGKLLFRGQYCNIDVTPPLPPKENFYKMGEVLDELKNFSQRDTVIAEAAKYAHFFHFLTLRLGICVPSGCSLDDVDQLAKQMGNALSLSASATRCEVKEEPKYTTLVIMVITCYSFAGLLMLIGSLIDLYGYYKKIIFRSKLIRALVCFSLFSNFKKLVNTETASDTLSCLNGVRFFCMSWVILGHTYLAVNFQIFLGLEKVRAYASDFAFQAVINASVAVDTFFFMGGLLVCYVTIKLVKLQNQKFNIFFYIFHRLWRILPVYIFVIMLLFFYDLMGSGPIWHDTTHKHMEACYNNWWTNLIFINNFYDAEHMCILHSWYIASDFQLYIGAILILLPLLRWPKVGISLTIITILACIVYSGLATYLNNFPPTSLFVHPDPDQRMKFGARLYFKPFIHAGPYCIGILAGYLLATKPDLKIPKLIQILGWSLAFIFNFSVLYGVVEWNRGADPTIFESVLYASLNRIAWTLGVAWMIIACATGHGGVIKYILSWKTFIPLGRLTYVAYLIHPIVQIACVGNIRTQIQPDHFLAVWIYCGHLCVTYASAFVGSMLIEAPFMSLEKLLLTTAGKKESGSEKRKNSILRGTLQTKQTGDFSSQESRRTEWH